VQQQRYRALLGPPTDRIFFHNVWFADGHNNPRYEELLPRLRRVDTYMALCRGQRIRRGVEFRWQRFTAKPRTRMLMKAAYRRYPYALCTDFDQIPVFPGRVVVDVDDPYFGEWEPRLLSSPNVAAYVVTDERLARYYESEGCTTPWEVVPQGVPMEIIRPAETAQIGRTKNGLVFGFVSAYLLCSGDRGSDDLFHNIDHLLDLWARIDAEVPDAQLWLIGGLGEHAARRCASMRTVRTFGRLPRADTLEHVTNFDVALYPRLKGDGIQAVKIAEYMACGVPTVSYDYDVTRVLADAHAGVLVDSPTGFVEACVSLARNDTFRGELARSAREAGARHAWEELAARYNEVLDRYLPA
jgi:glycosyltransferase involved in cell wall biosynthesis